VPAAELEVIEPETADLPSPEKGMAQESVSENGLDQEQEQASREPEKEMEKQEPTAGTEADQEQEKAFRVPENEMESLEAAAEIEAGQEQMMDNAQPDRAEVPEAAIEETVAQPPAVPEEPLPAEVPEGEMIEAEETPFSPAEADHFEIEEPPADNLRQELTRNAAEAVKMEGSTTPPPEQPPAESGEDEKRFRLRMKSSTLSNLNEYRIFRRGQGGMAYRSPEDREF
jgi:hypothetical protein